MNVKQEWIERRILQLYNHYVFLTSKMLHVGFEPTRHPALINRNVLSDWQDTANKLLLYPREILDSVIALKEKEYV